MHVEFGPDIPPGLFTVCCCTSDGCNDEAFTKDCRFKDVGESALTTAIPSSLHHDSSAGFIYTSYYMIAAISFLSLLMI